MLLNNLCTRSQHKVKGIAKNNLGANLRDITRQHPFYRAIGAHRHKSWCLNLTAGKGQLTTTGIAIGFVQFKLHRTASVTHRWEYPLLRRDCEIKT